MSKGFGAATYLQILQRREGGHMPATFLEDLDTLADRSLSDLLDLTREAGHPTWVLFRQEGGRTITETECGLVAPYEIDLPEDFSAVGIVATGRLWALDPTSEAAAGIVASTGGGIGLAYVVDRRGRVGWSSTAPNGPSCVSAPCEGAVVDALRRMLGLPTPPAAAPVEYAMVVLWLQEIEDLARALNECLTWTDALLIKGGDGPQSWEGFRAAVASRGAYGSLCESAMAAWMDEGMFARHVLGCLPDLRAQWKVTRPHLVPSAARSLSAIVHAVARGDADRPWDDQ